MSEEIPVAEGEVPKSKKAQAKRGCFIVSLGMGIFLILFGFVTGMSFHLEAVWYLLVGWILFLIANIKDLELNLEMTLCGVAALLIATYGLHRLLIWVRGEKPWMRSWTLSITALMLMLFGSSIAMTGMIHQLGWMVREPLTQSNRRGNLSLNRSNVKLLHILLVEYEYENKRLPQNLDELFEDGYIDAEGLHIFTYYPERKAPAEPWIYLGAGKSFFNEEGQVRDNEVLIISPHPTRGKWIILRADGAATSLKKQELREKHPELLEQLPHLLGAE